MCQLPMVILFEPILDDRGGWAGWVTETVVDYRVAFESGVFETVNFRFGFGFFEERCGGFWIGLCHR